MLATQGNSRKTYKSPLGDSKQPLEPKFNKNLLWQDIVFYRPEKQPMAQPVYIALNDALKIVCGERMLNISCIQLWYMDTIIVEQDRTTIYGFLEPQTIQPSGNTLDSRQSYMQTWITESKRELYIASYIDGVMARPRAQQIEIIYPKCNKETNSWACGYYNMSWMKTIIRVRIRADWAEWFNNTNSLPKVVIKKLRGEWAGYLNQNFH
ncbi:hypothetical protein LR48_Vigan11g065100 [Vigna angularis]|uniref:Uncharacterized protein n=1 Tax=Phaseolus angularis TaxID=3914 RepID=A0A0L9VRP5_PHAAN|nr:hypothetical protein LR48_Vigan11g065100 [Vigna angularis]